MSAEEERLRRAVARGAGEGEIRKLLGIVALTGSTPFSTEPVLVTCVACRSAAP